MAAAVLTSSTHMNVIVFCTINTTRWMIDKVRGTIGRGRRGLVQRDKCQGQWSTLSGVLTRVLSVECIVVKCTCTAIAFLIKSTSWACETWVKSTLAESGSAQSLVSSSKVMKCAIAESYTHIGQAQIDKSEVKNRASEEHNRRGDDHTGTPVRERELG